MLKTRHRYSMPAQEARLSIYYSQTTAYDGDNAQGKRNFAFRCTDELRAKKRVGRTLFTRCIAIAGAMPGRKTRPFESSNQSGHVEKKNGKPIWPRYIEHGSSTIEIPTNVVRRRTLSRAYHSLQRSSLSSFDN